MLGSGNQLCFFPLKLCIVLWCTLIQGCWGESPSLYNCTEYVAEGRDLHCDCQPSSSSPSSTVSWPGHSSNSTLTVTNVNRTMNGTRYVCQQTTPGSTAKGSVTYTLRVAYGPDDKNVTVSQQPSPFVVDGVSNVTLTCQATVYPKADYTWKYTPGNTPINCVHNIVTINTCTYIPQMNNTDMLITCSCLNAQSTRFQTTEFQPAFQYPPQTPPNISIVQEGPLQSSIVDEASTQDPILGPGSRLKCEVSGGKPLVENVHFVCESPHHVSVSLYYPHGDTPGATEAAPPGVVAREITMNNFQDQDGNMTCTCSATWSVRPDLYLNITTKSFNIMYEPSIFNFTVNSEAALTVDDTPQSVTLRCVARGRPAPSIKFYDSTDKEMSDLTVTENITSTTESARSVTYVLTDCQQTGVYKCDASNTVPSARIYSTVVVNVTCLPTSADSTFKTNIPTVHVAEHLTFTLKANPPPHIFQFLYVGGGTVNSQMDDVTSGTTNFTFTSICTPNSDLPYLVTCSVAVMDVSAEYMGVFNGTAISSKGTFEFQFIVKPKVSTDASTLIVAIVIGAVVAAVVVAVVVLCVLVIIRRRRTKACRRQEDPSSKDPPAPKPLLYEEAWDLKRNMAALNAGNNLNMELEPLTLDGPDSATEGAANGSLYETMDLSTKNRPDNRFTHQNSNESSRRLISRGESSDSSDTPSARSKSDRAGNGMRLESASEHLSGGAQASSGE